MPHSSIPSELKLHRQSATLELIYGDGQSCTLSAEFLRVHSPSAEVRGHGKGQQVLQTGKRDVRINSIEPVGNYGIKPVFDDGHASGIFSWEYLLELAQNQQSLWQQYLAKLQAAGAGRAPLPPDTRTIQVRDSPD